MILLIVISTICQKGYCDIKNPIPIEAVDSVVILCANPKTSREPAIARPFFENAYRIYESNGKKDKVYRILLSRPEDYTIFLKILNTLEPLPPEEVKVKPSEVMLLTTRVSDLSDLMPIETNDPITVNKKIKIYMRNGIIRTAYASRFYLDIDDWRYMDASTLEVIMEWFIFNEM